MASINPSYNPSQIMLGQGSGGRGYLPTMNPGGPPKPNPAINPGAPPPSQTFGAQSVRATGSGPFDAAYRQNLATYAGGLFARPGGNLSFNPTNAASFPGSPTGGGTAPVLGMPDSLLSQAIGGQQAQNPPPTSPSSGGTPQGNLQSQGNSNWWLQQFLNQGNLFGLPGFSSVNNQVNTNG